MILRGLSRRSLTLMVFQWQKKLTQQFSHVLHSLSCLVSCLEISCMALCSSCLLHILLSEMKVSRTLLLVHSVKYVTYSYSWASLLLIVGLCTTICLLFLLISLQNPVTMLNTEQLLSKMIVSILLESTQLGT